MDVRSNFHYTPRNAKGAIQNGVAVLDPVANAPQLITSVENMNALDIGNNTSNRIQVTAVLTDDQGVTAPMTFYMFAGSTESYSFDGKFIQSVSVAAVDEPVATIQDSTGLALAAVAVVGGQVDVNLIET